MEDVSFLMRLLWALSHLSEFQSRPAGFTIHLPLHAASEAECGRTQTLLSTFLSTIFTGEELVLGPRRIPL